MASKSWRQQFIELSEGIFRELGFPPPSQLHEESLPLAMSLTLEEIAFELVHSPTFQPHRLLVTSSLGTLPEQPTAASLAALLKSNLRGIRRFDAWFGLHPDFGNFVRLETLDLNDLHPAQLLDRLRQIASDSQQWNAAQPVVTEARSDKSNESIVSSLA